MEYNHSIGDIIVYNGIKIKVVEIYDGAYGILHDSNYDNKFLFDGSQYIVARGKLDVLNNQSHCTLTESEKTYFTECVLAKKMFDKRIYELSNIYIYDEYSN